MLSLLAQAQARVWEEMRVRWGHSRSTEWLLVFLWLLMTLVPVLLERLALLLAGRTGWFWQELQSLKILLQLWVLWVWLLWLLWLWLLPSRLVAKTLTLTPVLECLALLLAWGARQGQLWQEHPPLMILPPEGFTFSPGLCWLRGLHGPVPSSIRLPSSNQSSFSHAAHPQTFRTPRCF